MNPAAYRQAVRSEETKKKLYSCAMKGHWQEIIEIYEKDPEAHTAKISGSGDTALHIAIFDGREAVVEKLVSIIAEKNPDVDSNARAKTEVAVEEPVSIITDADADADADANTHTVVHANAHTKANALKIKNGLGNTPLHVASYLGKVRMCYYIAKRDSTLIGLRNNANETPLFLAVLHGRKDVFRCLHSLCKDPGEGYRYCRRDKGETILHSAIYRERFDLAFEIIQHYGYLQHWVDERGFLPLHILASKPSAFRSGSRLRGMSLFVKKQIHGGIPSQGSQDNVDNLKASLSLPWLRNITRAQMHHNVKMTDTEDPSGQQLDHEQVETSKIIYRSKGEGHVRDFVPKKSFTCSYGLKSMLKPMLEFLLGKSLIKKIREETKKHIWSVEIMDLLIKDSYSDMVHVEPIVDDDQNRPPLAYISLETVQSKNQGTIGNGEKDTVMKNGKKETPLLIAAKHGTIEMVDKILEKFPSAIHEMNGDEKNIVLLAVEHRQPHVYQYLLQKHKILQESIFYKVDKDGNSALHLAAMPASNKRNWLTTGPALQMQWEVKWYEFVENSMPFNFFVRHNYEKKTPWEIFSEGHEKLVMEGGQWLTNTSQSCSVVATLIATVAFTASTAIPGGFKSESGIPILEREPAFSIFAISTVVALCFSVSSVVMFMVFFTSRYHVRDFARNLPAKLLLELTSLLISIAAVVVSFCAAHFFLIKDHLKHIALPLYAVTCLPVAFYAIWQFPMYLGLAAATLRKLPQRIYK